MGCAVPCSSAVYPLRSAVPECPFAPQGVASQSQSPSPPVKLGIHATWSDWDLNVCLSKECRWKGLKRASHFDFWMNLKFMYKTFYGRTPENLEDALKRAGIKFKGRAHSGIVDARNTAALLTTMMARGMVVGITKSSPAWAAAGGAKAKAKKNAQPARAKGMGQQSKGKAGKADKENTAAAVHTHPTPPLCDCKRCAKRAAVCTPGPNIGRSYFTCGQTRVDERCSFFIWGR